MASCIATDALQTLAPIARDRQSVPRAPLGVHQGEVAAARVRTVNSNDPSPGNVTEEKQAALDEFIANCKILIGSLGYRVFDAVDEAKNLTRELAVESSEVEPLLYLKAAGAKGQGRQTKDGFVVLAESTLRLETKDSFPESGKRNREKHAEYISPEGELLRDTLFNSPSAASNFLIGSSTSGKEYWKNSEGISLKDLELAEIAATKEH